MKAIRVINNELIEIMEYKNPRICFNDYELEDVENYCVFKETINPFQLYKELQRKDKIINEIKKELTKDYNTYVCKNKSYGKTFKAGAETYKEHLLYKIKKLEEK